MENINSTNKGIDLLLANKARTVLWGTERMPQRIQRHRRVILHRSAHSQREQDQTEKSSYGPDWQQKCVWYSLAKLDDNLPQNIQNIRWSHKLYRENHENLESGIDSRREKLNWSEGPKTYFSKEMHYHRHCSWLPWCHDATCLENTQPDTNLVNYRKKSIT